MIRKFIPVVISALCFSLLLTSCYPELSVQQYDELKEDLEVLNHQSAAMEEELIYVKDELTSANEELAYLIAENGILKANNKEIKAYTDFMVKLFATQNTEKLLNGEFDVAALVSKKEELLKAADNLTDSNIYRFLSVIDAENEVETMGAYYQILSTCVKNIKQKLGTPPSSANGNGTKQ
ncbi:MAG: hypothetical protein JW712_03110 [Dehalococcoidales bacterium]|nr:hypothetical protein [Dehalococcoidales bacterium]